MGFLTITSPEHLVVKDRGYSRRHKMFLNYKYVKLILNL